MTTHKRKRFLPESHSPLNASNDGVEISNFYSELTRQSTPHKGEPSDGVQCDVCHERISSLEWSDHKTSSLHLFNTNNTLPDFNKHISIPTNNKGYKMLRELGWKEDEGLGVNNQGILEPIPTIQKKDRRGIGSKPPTQNSNTIKKKKPVRAKIKVTYDVEEEDAISKKEMKRMEEYEKQKERAIRDALYHDFEGYL